MAEEKDTTLYLATDGLAGECPDMIPVGGVVGGKYEIRDKLGEGGQGVVYLAFNRERQSECALKTFLPGFLNDPGKRRIFQNECQTWINLPEHPFIIAAQWIQEIHGRLFVQMDFVPHDAYKRTTLSDHLQRGPKPDISTITQWALQFCLGMEHAAAHGIRCHRDIKPGNILISPAGEVRIADFGLATAARAAGQICGTTGYFAPEVFRGDGADMRSDVYSFGVVFWQIATGRPSLPYACAPRRDRAAYWRDIHDEQMAGPPPIDGPFAAMIQRCLMADPASRYSNFADLRQDLQRRFPESISVTLASLQPDGRAVIKLSNRGASLHTLGRYDEAMECYREALRIDPKHVATWNNLANMLLATGRGQEAIDACREALRMDPKHVRAAVTEAIALRTLNRLPESLASCDRAVELDPGDTFALCERGNTLLAMGNPSASVENFDRVLAIDAQSVTAWTGKGHASMALESIPQAAECFERATAINPQDALAWNDFGNCLTLMNDLKRAEKAYRACIALDRDYAPAFNNLGNTLQRLGDDGEAIYCFGEAARADKNSATPWVNRGALLLSAGKPAEAADSFRSALKVDPRMAQAWRGLGIALEAMQQYESAEECFSNEMSLTPQLQDPDGDSLTCPN